MNWLRYSCLVVVLGMLAGCGGSGGGGGTTPQLTDTAFVFTTVEVSTTPEKLYYATVSDPTHPVLLHSVSTTGKVFGSVGIDPTGSKIYYNDPEAPNTIRVVNKDGTGDQVFYTSAHPTIYPHAFNPAGKMLVFEMDNGNTFNSQMDVATKALTANPMIAGEPEPSSPQWRKDKKEFVFFWFDGGTSNFQVWKAVVSSGAKSLVADNTYGGQFAPDNTILGPNSQTGVALNRYTEKGVLLDSYPTTRGFTSFRQVGTKGFLENGDEGPSGDTNIEYYKYDKSAPINVTPTIPDRVELLDAVTFPAG